MPDAVWFILALLLLIGAVVLGAWALFWDRPRGRLRCPKCQYRMEGIAASTVSRKGRELSGNVCPECGYVATKVAHLQRTRRRWKALWLVALMLLGFHVTSHVPAWQQSSFRVLVPTCVLVTVWPLSDLTGVSQGPWENSGQNEMQSRLEEHWPTWMERLWVRRLLKQERKQLSPDPRLDPLQQRVYNLRPLWKPLRFGAPWYDSPEEQREANPGMPSYSPGWGGIDDTYFTRRGWEDGYTLAVAHLIGRAVHPDQWRENGGNGGLMIGGVSHLAVLADPQILDDIDRFLADLEAVASASPGEKRICNYLDPPVAIYNCADLRGTSDTKNSALLNLTFREIDCGYPEFILRGAIVFLIDESPECRSGFEGVIQKCRESRMPATRKPTGPLE